MSKYYGYQVDENMTLSDAQAVFDGTGKDSSNIRYAGNSGGLVEIRVYANTAITIATDEVLKIELECYSSATAASAAPPFKNSASGWVDDAHFYMLYKDASDDGLSFSAGDLITAMVIPEGLLRDRPYVQLKYATTTDDSDQKIDAFLHVLA